MTFDSLAARSPRAILRSVLALALLAVACTGENTAPAEVMPVGTWRLHSVDGSPPPVMIARLAGTELVDLVYTLNEDGTFKRVESWRTTLGDSVTYSFREASGVYEKVISGVRFTLTNPSIGSPWVASIK